MTVTPNPVSGNVLANDTDVDSGDTHSVSAVNGSAAKVGTDVAGTYGTLHLNANGSYTYTLDNTKASVQALAQGASVTDVFKIGRASCRERAEIANLTVTINSNNDAPVAVADATSVKEDTNTLADPNPVSGNVLTNDTDVDSGHKPRYTAAV